MSDGRWWSHSASWGARRASTGCVWRPTISTRACSTVRAPAPDLRARRADREALARAGLPRAASMARPESAERQAMPVVEAGLAAWTMAALAARAVSMAPVGLAARMASAEWAVEAPLDVQARTVRVRAAAPPDRE